ASATLAATRVSRSRARDQKTQRADRRREYPEAEQAGDGSQRVGGPYGKIASVMPPRIEPPPGGSNRLLEVVAQLQMDAMVLQVSARFYRCCHEAQAVKQLAFELFVL